MVDAQIGHRRGSCAGLIYPGSALSWFAGSEIKRITAGVKARRWSQRQVRAGGGPSPSNTLQCRTK